MLRNSQLLLFGDGMEIDITTADIQSALAEKVANNIHKLLSAAKTTDDKAMFNEIAASSAVMGIQLNIPAW